MKAIVILAFITFVQGTEPRTQSTESTALAIISQTLEQYESQESIMDEPTFKNFCQLAFDGANAAAGERSPEQLFRSLFDRDGDGTLTSVDERDRFKKWLHKISSKPKSALVVVDFQYDFINGSLSIRGGPAHQDPESIINPLNRLIDTVPFDLVVYTYDWHPPNHISFVKNVDTRPVSPDSNHNGGWKMGDIVPFLIDGRVVNQSVWPTHCVQNSTGAELHWRLRVVDDQNRLLRVYKGQNPEVDQYSAFFDNEHKGETNLRKELTNRGITDLYLSGLAYDVCVSWTAQDALDLGYKTAIIDDCARGLDLDAIQAARNRVLGRNGLIVQSQDVAGFVSGKRVPWSWAYATAVRLLHK